MGIETAIAVTAGAGLVNAFVQNEQGRRAASAQGDIANAQLAQQQADRAAALQMAEPTPEELAQLQQAIALNEQDIQRKTKLLESSDPALIESGKQALALLRGEEAKALDPLRRQQAKDREKLKDTLRAQLGSGFENTSAGIQALAAFDEAAQNAQFNAQQATLGQLLGVAQNVQSFGNLQSNIANASGFASQYGGISSRKASAISGTPITGAGAQYVEGLQQARNSMQTFQNLAGTATLGSMLYAQYGGTQPDAFALSKPSASDWSPTAGTPYGRSGGGMNA